MGLHRVFVTFLAILLLGEFAPLSGGIKISFGNYDKHHYGYGYGKHHYGKHYYGKHYGGKHHYGKKHHNKKKYKYYKPVIRALFGKEYHYGKKHYYHRPHYNYGYRPVYYVNDRYDDYDGRHGSKHLYLKNEYNDHPIGVAVHSSGGVLLMDKEVGAQTNIEFKHRYKHLGKYGHYAKIYSPHWARGESVTVYFDRGGGEHFKGPIKLSGGKHYAHYKVRTEWNGYAWVIIVDQLDPVKGHK